MKRRHNKSTAARLGGLTLHAYGDSRVIAERARKGFERRFYEKALDIDPDLRGQALEKKVELLKKLYFTALAKKSVESRSRKRRR